MNRIARFDVVPTTRRWMIELFTAGNLAFLAFDIWLAHSMNRFAHWEEWIPFAFSLVAPWLLLPGLITRRPDRGFARLAGWFVGVVAIVVGVTGLVLHLHATFFVHQTFHNLVYTAPFAAPLAYAGLGLLLILNRTEAPDGEAYGRWVTLLAAGGFAGNFVLALADHAQNGFFHASEWIAVVAAACGFAFLLGAVWAPRDRGYLKLCGVVMAMQVLVGLLGAGLHLRAILAGHAESFWVNAVHAAPLLAPMLFADLAILGGLGLWCQWSHAGEGHTQSPELHRA